MKRDLLSVFDFSADEIWDLIQRAIALKQNRSICGKLSGKILGLIFEKPSTRTSISFSVAIYELGGLPLMLDAKNLQRKRGESISDTAKTLSRYLSAVVIRAFNHKDVAEFAAVSDIPVINGLTDLEHPCQIFGDFQTIIEKKALSRPAGLKGVKIAFVGDGNNVANSLMACSALLGCDFTLAFPKGYGPDEKIYKNSQAIAKQTGSKILLTDNPSKAAQDADVIYTDVWTSMGAESESEKRKKAFKPYQVNKKLLLGAKDDVIVLHCLPAHRGEEITADVIDGANSSIFDQAENRLHIQKSILLKLLA